MVCILFASVAASAPSHAEDAPAPDKSEYTLLNPVPEDKMSSFCTDRPTKTNLPCTVDAGHFQYEADAFNWTYSHNDGVTKTISLFTNPTFKLGLTSRMDFEVNVAPLVEVDTRDKAAHISSDLTGVGDTFLRVKYNLFGNDGGDTAMTVLPYVKIPTAPPGIGNKAVEEGLIVPISFNLPQGFSLVLDPEIDDFRNADNSGYHMNYQGIVNIGHSVFSDSVTAYAELWSGDNRDPAGATAQTSFDTALAWLARPDLQLDAGANIGLNRATPDFECYFGVSQRF